MPAAVNGNGAAVLDPEPARGELVVRESSTISVAPQTTAEDLKARMALIRKVMEDEMKAGVDYGYVPGSKKPSLFKPGAEKLVATFQLDPQFHFDKELGPGDHLTVDAHAVIFDARTTSRLGSGDGLCTTRERKYAYRAAERICPSCGKTAIIKGKEEYGGGWVCFKKKDGCNAKFKDGDRAIEAQPAGEIENPDLPDYWNTAVKMARKRALVDAVLLVTGASAIFTQDLEDRAAESPEEPHDEQLPYGPANEIGGRTVEDALIALVGDEPTARRAWGEILARCGYMPACVADAFLLAHRTRDNLREQGVPSG